ncbi:MAG TPA: hypothetical protein DCZ10_02290 [Pelotomaculum sp.]|nr:hypothetical protein [Pelotomaculum sp.]
MKISIKIHNERFLIERRNTMSMKDELVKIVGKESVRDAGDALLQYAADFKKKKKKKKKIIFFLLIIIYKKNFFKFF